MYAVHTGEIELMAKIEEMRSLLASEKKAEAKAAREREAAYARQQREAAKQQEKIHAEEKKVSCVRLISSSCMPHTHSVCTLQCPPLSLTHRLLLCVVCAAGDDRSHKRRRPLPPWRRSS